METPDPKTEDFKRNPTYEHRVVAFYDMLGWRSQIARAGSDPIKIGNLRRMILRAARMLAAQRERVSLDIQFSTFSDNVVISTSPERSAIVHLLGTLGCFQLGSVSGGFLVRGGISIGDIVHDEQAVFGPALNRAYEIESTVAQVPRIVLDPDKLSEFHPLPFFVAIEDDLCFIDPFTLDFLSIVQQIDSPQPNEFWRSVGIPVPSSLNLRAVPPDYLLRETLNGIKPMLREPLGDREWQKLAWLYDRIAGRLGVPLASSYPRRRP